MDRVGGAAVEDFTVVILATVVKSSSLETEVVMVAGRRGVDLMGGVARVLSGGDRFTVVFIATVPLARTVGILDVVLAGAVRTGGLTLT